MKKLKKIIGQRIREQRKKLNLSQEELAFRVGLHFTFIGKIERGEKIASVATLKKIADALKISLTYLVADETEKNIYLQEILDLLKKKQVNELKKIINVIRAME